MDSNFIRNRIKFYEDKKKNVDSGNFNYVPFFGFNKLCKYVPGIIPSILYKITSHMGAGKTQLAKYLFVYQPLLFAIKNKIDFKIIYLSLEESKEEFIDSLFLHLAKRIEKVNLNRFALGGFTDTSLTSSEITSIKKVELALANLAKNIEIVDDVYSPTGLYNACRKYAKKWGTFTKSSNGNEVYKPHNPNQIVLVVTDHISLISEEYDPELKTYLNQFKAIAKWHTHYCRRVLAKEWNWAILNIQQQTLESEKQQFSYKGTTIVEKLLPTLDGLANNKEVGRDDYVTFGLFAPERYGVDNYRGIPISDPASLNPFGDRYRDLILLKNRLGPPNKSLNLYFDGRYTYFKEMPRSYKDPAMMYFNTLLKT